jgi:hypothetical protein
MAIPVADHPEQELTIGHRTKDLNRMLKDENALLKDEHKELLSAKAQISRLPSFHNPRGHVRHETDSL